MKEKKSGFEEIIESLKRLSEEITELEQELEELVGVTEK